jgi:ATP dependent DNA ligase domain
MLHVRARRPVGYIPPCLPSRAERPPSGPEWLHEIKHDGFRIMARRDSKGVRLYTRNGYDFADRFPQIVEAVTKLKVRSCLIDGEAIVVDERGLSAFDLLRSWRHDHAAAPYRSGRVEHWLKIKNPVAPAIKREAEEDWGNGATRGAGAHGREPSPRRFLVSRTQLDKLEERGYLDPDRRGNRADECEAIGSSLATTSPFSQRGAAGKGSLSP